MATTDTADAADAAASAIKVIIYSTPTCAFCKTEKQYLDHLGVLYIVKDVEEDPSAMEELIAKSNQQAVPVTDIDGVIIRGFDRLKIDLTLKEKALV